MKTHSPKHFLRCLIPSRLEAVDAACLELRAFMTANGLAADTFAVELVSRECLNNTVLHGNQNQADKTATMSLSLGRRWLRLQIADQGVGFNWRQACRTAADPTASTGRGLAISMLYADRVEFNQRGNQVTLWFDNSSTAKRHQHGNIHA